MRQIIKISIVVVAVMVIALSLYALIFARDNHNRVEKGRINKIDTMVELCSIDFYNEIPIVDTIQNYVCFAKQKQRGSISFDIENLDIETEDDYIQIILPPEIIEIMESTDDNAWESIDSKNLSMPDRFNFFEAPKEVWTAVKKNALLKSKQNLYQTGIVERARVEGAENLQMLMEKVYRKPVKVIDPTPKGAHYDEFK